MNKKVRTKDLYECKTSYLDNIFSLCEYPWQMLPILKEYIVELINKGIDDFRQISNNLLVGKDVYIHPTATIESPAILGHSTVVRPGAYIRGAVITGSNCVLGNSSEFKNCILLDNVQAPHYNYVGDSVLGNGAHLGAGAICSNLKSDSKPVIIHSDVKYETSLRKVGAFLADGTDVGCGCVLNPGTVLGKNTSVYPLNSLRGVFPAGRIVKSQENIVVRK